MSTSLVTSATARKRRYRRLLKDGGAVLRVPVRDFFAVIDVLISLRWLAEHESEDRKQIGIAAGELLDDLAAWKRSPAWTDKLRDAWHAREHD